VILSTFDDMMRVARPDLYYFRRNLPSILITIMVTPLLYYVSFGYGLAPNVSEIEGVSYVAFVIPGVIALSTLTSCFSSIANKVLVQRVYYSSFDEVILCPISPSAVILGKAFIGFVRGMIGATILIAIGLLMSDMEVNLTLMLCVVVSCIVASLLGVLVGLISNSLTHITMFTSLIIVPMTFLCGTVFSVSSLPGPVQYAVWAMPLTYSTDVIRSAALGWEFPFVSLGVLVAFGVAFFLICRYLLVKGKV